MLPQGPLLIPMLPGPPELVWRVPGSKSITNRALVLAALAQGESQLRGALESDDTRHMRVALQGLGVPIRVEDETTWTVEGGRQKLRAPSAPLYVGNSGTTLRFLTALAALVPGRVTLAGDEAMARRPVQDLVDALGQLGVRVECPTGCPPLTVHGGRLPGGRARIRGDRSSQYFSALLMAAGHADGDLEIEIEGTLVSRPYVAITCRMIEDFGGRATSTREGFRSEAKGYRGRAYTIEPDASSASYPFALAAATGGSIQVPGLTRGALQGDHAFVDLLARMGARVECSTEGTLVAGPESLTAVEANMHDISDTVMTLAAIAPLARGTTRIVDVANIRIKETDRLTATVAELGRLGQQVTSGDDWLQIEPRPLTPALVRCYGDHRMAMSFAVLGAARGGVTIDDPPCVQKTYPGFWRDLERAYPSPGLFA